jgi:hypothetical protein
MLAFVCFKWKSPQGYRSTFGPQAVNTLRAMVDRHYRGAHEFVCITDDPTGIDGDIRIVPLWNDFADLPSPHGGKNPSCYRRLKMYAPEAADIIGPRFVAMDLDVVITGPLNPLFDRPEDFVIWGDTNPQPGSHYNGSLVLMTAGARKQVWERFDPVESPKASLKAKCWGSDQGWISYCLGPGETKWTKADGVYSYRNHINTTGGQLPANARLVVFHGSQDPWSEKSKRLPWVREHYVGQRVEAVA